MRFGRLEGQQQQEEGEEEYDIIQRNGMNEVRLIERKKKWEMGQVIVAYAVGD